MKKTGDKLCFNVLLVGPRRSGKSSVLASMIDSFKNISAGTYLHIVPDYTTRQLTEKKLINLQKTHNILREAAKNYPCFAMDEEQTSESSDYTFSISYLNRNAKRVILADAVFQDRPGEWLSDPEHRDEMKELVGEADILLIAIDTIHLMEERGVFCRNFHRIGDMRDCISGSEFLEENSGNKLVLFVPLKCERYYHDGRMNEVQARIHDEMSNLIDLLTADKVKNRVTLGIAPILTIGGIEFDSFGRDEEGHVIQVRDRGQGNQLYLRPNPNYIYYRFWKTDPSFRPMFCEQPALYLLYYIASTVKKENLKKMNLIGFLIYLITSLLRLSRLFSSTNVTFSLSLLQSKIKRSGNGYEIINNPLGI